MFRGPGSRTSTSYLIPPRLVSNECYALYSGSAIIAGMDFDAWIGNNKALWARVYDEVIAPDLEKEWKKRTRP